MKEFLIEENSPTVKRSEAIRVGGEVKPLTEFEVPTINVAGGGETVPLSNSNTAAIANILVRIQDEVLDATMYAERLENTLSPTPLLRSYEDAATVHAALLEVQDLVSEAISVHLGATHLDCPTHAEEGSFND